MSNHLWRTSLSNAGIYGAIAKESYKYAKENRQFSAIYYFTQEGEIGTHEAVTTRIVPDSP
jgi:hypothetical protein